MKPHANLAVVIPCYKVKKQIVNVINEIPTWVHAIYVIDDCCPQGSGAFVQKNFSDDRIKIIFHKINQGVGGAVCSGYRAALEDKIDIVVKIDGDGQMNPALIPQFIRPIQKGRADYTKGNRFFRPASLRGMPLIRLLGNAALSFINKFSTGYWSIMDPVNGYTAINTRVLRELPLEKIEKRYFFETDMLYQLNLVRAVVHDIPMDAVYADEESSLKISKVLPEFALKHLIRFFKRYCYQYLIRDFNIGSIYSLSGLLFLFAGGLFGMGAWIHSLQTNIPATSGTVMLAALPVIVGIQLMIAFLHHDVSREPATPLCADLPEDPDDLETP